MNPEPSKTPESGWTPAQRAELGKALSAPARGRRSFLRHSVFVTVALAGAVTLTPSEARAQGSGY